MDMLLATPQLVATLSFLFPCVAFRETSDGPLSLSLPPASIGEGGDATSITGDSADERNEQKHHRIRRERSEDGGLSSETRTVAKEEPRVISSCRECSER
jgi:hypothetical protein